MEALARLGGPECQKRTRVDAELPFEGSREIGGTRVASDDCGLLDTRTVVLQGCECALKTAVPYILEDTATLRKPEQTLQPAGADARATCNRFDAQTRHQPGVDQFFGAP